MNIGLLLAITAVVEAVTALALIVLPSTAAKLLLGVPLEAPAAVIVARVTGCALFALALICWTIRNDANRAPLRVVAAMLLYNLAVAALLVYAYLGVGLTGIGMIPAVLAHAALGVCCGACLRASPQV